MANTDKNLVREEYDRHEKFSLGKWNLGGLQNLGNTCFMNVSLSVPPESQKHGKNLEGLFQFNEKKDTEVNPAMVSHAVLGCVTWDHFVDIFWGYSAVYGEHAIAVALAANKGEINAPSHISFETVSIQSLQWT